MEDPEIEMRYLKEKRKDDDTIYTMDPQLLTGLKTLRDIKKNASKIFNISTQDENNRCV